MRISSPQIDDSGGGGNGIHSIRDRFPFKRNHNHFPGRTKAASDRPSSRSRLQHGRFNRKGIFWLFPFRGKYLFYFGIFFAVFVFSIASMVLQSSITSVFRPGSETRRWFKEELKFGSALKFVPGKVSLRFAEGDGLDWARSKPSFGVRAPRLALVLGNMEKNAPSLMLITVIKNIQKLGYVLKIFATENGKARSMWEQLDGGKLSILRREHYNHIDWSMFDGIVADSLEAKEVILRLGLSQSGNNKSNKTHGCSICGAEFSSGQALGGHMRRHRAPLMATSSSSLSLNPLMEDSKREEQQNKRKRSGISLDLDLNLPAQPEDHNDLRESKLTSFISSKQQKKRRQHVFSSPALVDCHY